MFRRFVTATGMMVILALLLASCGEEDATATPGGNTGGQPEATATTPAEEQPELAGTSWMLDEMDGEALPDGIEVRLTFDTEGVNGTVCNTYGGGFESDTDGTLSFTDLFQTEMYCGEPDGIMDVESAYLTMLQEEVEGYRIEDDRLLLLDSDGETLLVFEPQDTGAVQPFDGTLWILSELDGEKPVEEPVIIVRFDEGRVGGKACNTFGGDYTATEDGEITIGDMMSTMMACMEPEGLMDQEAALFIGLRESVRFERTDDSLTLFDEAGDARVVLTKPDPDTPIASDDNRTWVLTAINGEPLESDLPFTMQFTVNGPAGRADCMSYYTTPTAATPGNWTVYGHDGLCDEDADTTEAEAFIAALESADDYSESGNTLTITDADGMVTLEFTRGFGSGELEKTSWVLTEIQGEPLVSGTEITLRFEGENAMGDGGCNGYGGPFMIVKRGVISFIDIFRTEMDCMEPEGIMEQETAYLNTLPHAVGYTFVEDSAGEITGLELANADGETLLVFEVAP